MKGIVIRMKVRTYVVFYRDSNGEFHEEWIQALSATQAVDILGIPEEWVRDVTVRLDDWKKSKFKGQKKMEEIREALNALGYSSTVEFELEMIDDSRGKVIWSSNTGIYDFNRHTFVD